LFNVDFHRPLVSPSPGRRPATPSVLRSS
jgi:hypothetical protein